MGNSEVGGFIPESERSPLEVAQVRWGVDLNDDRATLNKLIKLQGKMPDVTDLSNLWQDYQQEKSIGDLKEAA